MDSNISSKADFYRSQRDKFMRLDEYDDDFSGFHKSVEEKKEQVPKKKGFIATIFCKNDKQK